MHFTTKLENAVDELWEMSVARNVERESYAVPRHFAALIAELCAQLVLMSDQEKSVELATHIRRHFAARD